MPKVSISDLIALNARREGIDPRRVVSASIPVHTPRRTLGDYQVKLGQASVSQLAAAITQAETGGNIQGNNPGNLELGDIGYGVRTAGGQQLTIFPTLAAGQAALQNQIQNIINGSGPYAGATTIAQVADIYTSGKAGSGLGANWANNVANYLGVSPSSPFALESGAEGGSLIEADAGAVNQAIEDETGFTPPAWLPYAIGGLAAYLALDALV